MQEDGEEHIPDHDLEKGQDNEETNPLMVPLHVEEQPTQEQIMEQWFSQDVFDDVASEGVFAKSDSEEDEKVAEEKLVRMTKKKKPNNMTVPLNTQVTARQDDFEIVPSEPLKADEDSSSSSSDEDSDVDEDSKAEILAYAKKMLRKKQREEILDDSYNKYMFDDEGLPTWFVEEEKRHCQPMKPITKEEVAAMRAQFREIDARPAKKVAEAKARKKRIAMKSLEKVRKKANTISDQTDISERSKGKMIEKLYKKAIPKRPQKEYVVSKKGVQVRPGKGKKLVDRRMKKDARGKGTKGGGKKGKAGKGKGKSGSKGKGSKVGGGRGGRK